MSNFKPVNHQMRKSLSRPVTTSNAVSSRKAITGSKTSIPHDVFSPISKKGFGLNSSNTKEETPSPAYSTLTSSKALNRTDRLSQGQDSFSTAVDAFKNTRRESIMSLKWGDASTKASSLASLNATLTSIPKIKSRTTFTAQSLSVLPSEAPSLVSVSHTNRFFNTNNAAQSLNDVETRKYAPGSELTSRNDLLTDREYESNLGGTLNNLEEKFADLEERSPATSLQREEMSSSKKAMTDRPTSNSKRRKNNNDYVITTTTPRIERKSSAQKQRPAVKKEKGLNDTSTKLKKRKSVIIVKKEKNSKCTSKKVKSEIPLVPLAKQFSSEKSPVKILNEPRSAGKIDLSKVIQAREIQDNQSVTSPRFDSTRLETMDEVQESSTSRSSIQPKFIVRRDFAAKSIGSQSLRKQSLEKLEVPAVASTLKSPAKEVFLNKPLETILSNFHENTEKSMEVRSQLGEDIRIDTITSLDDNIPVRNEVFENPKITKKKEVMNWFKDKLNAPEDAEKKVNLKVLEIISRRNHWRKVEEEAEYKKSEASPDTHAVFKMNGSNYLELNMENKFLKEYSSSSQINNKNIGGRLSFGERKDVRSNSSTMMVRHFDEFDPVVIQPKYMEETGSMCFTELWGKKSKNEFYKTMRKAFQSNTFVSLEPHCGLQRPEKGLTSEELMCRRIANGGISMTERRLSVKIPEDMGMTLSKKEHFSPRGGIGKHTRAFVLQGAGRVKQGTKSNLGSV